MASRHGGFGISLAILAAAVFYGIGCPEPPPPPPPDYGCMATAPPDATVVPGDSHNTVTWHSPCPRREDCGCNAPDGYRLHWTDEGEGRFDQDLVFHGMTSPFVHTGLVNGRHYWYAVVSTNEYGGALFMTDIRVDGIPLATPTSVSVTPGNAQNTISWDSAAGADGYRLYWTDNGTDPSKASLNAIREVTSPCVHSGISNGVEYRYVVTGTNATGEGDESAVVTAIPGT
jgi:hypothetical protein